MKFSDGHSKALMLIYVKSIDVMYCFVSAILRENKENCSLLKEEAEGLKRKLERMAKAKEDLVSLELEKEVNSLTLLVRFLFVHHQVSLFSVKQKKK